ncbi:MAG: DUF2249 domain-containing protein [Proteobacteria bacterium]|nr:DUF2249 domain-containing protein [Pseudomonadota bacterium]
MTPSFVDVDVRPILRSGGEPFGKIMQAVAALGPGEGIRLLATFKPTPLFRVMGSKGFTHEAREIGGGDWEVLFSPSASSSTRQESPAPRAGAPQGQKDSAWPEPVQHLDNRELDPPEPMVRILAATEKMAPGEVLSALLCREPIFLLPELSRRGHTWKGGFEPDGTTYKVLIRVGPDQAPAA